MSSIELMDTREKLIYLRKTLKTTQRALAGDTLTKEFISMVEGGKRNMSREVAITVMKNALNLANEKGIDLGLDEEYLTRSKEDDLCEICDKLDNTMDNMDNFNKIIEYAEENNYQWAKIMATKKIGNVFFVNKQVSKAYEKYISCINMIDKLNSNRYKECVYNCLGSTKFEMLQYEEALIYYEEALNYCYINNRFSTKSNIQYNLAMAYHNLGELDKALNNIEMSLKGDVDEILYVKLNLLRGNVYRELNSFEKALGIYAETLKHNNLENNFKAIAYDNMALCFMEKGQYNSSKKYFNMALNVAQMFPHMAYKIMVDMSDMNEKIGDYQEARNLLIRGMSLIGDIEDYKYRLIYLRQLYLLEEKSKNIKGQKDIAISMLSLARKFELQEQMLWARKKLIDIAIKENDLSILKEA